MPSQYLQSQEWQAYGSPNANDELVQQASTLIDAYLKRPEGMIFATTADQMPGYMVSKYPTFTLLSTAPISPGQNVTVPVAGPIGMADFGMCLVLDRSTNGTQTDYSEVCVINGITAAAGINPATVTLENVSFAHGSGCKMEEGLVVREQRQMPDARPITILSKWPIARPLSGRGRYGYGRRNSQNQYNMNDFNMLAALSHFGGPPVWERFDINLAGLDPYTGQLWTPSGILLAYYTEIRVHYVSGWDYPNLPPPIKQACARVIQGLQEHPNVVGNIKSMGAGDVKLERFGATVLDDDTKRMLEPYKARLYA